MGLYGKIDQPPSFKELMKSEDWVSVANYMFSAFSNCQIALRVLVEKSNYGVSNFFVIQRCLYIWFFIKEFRVVLHFKLVNVVKIKPWGNTWDEVNLVFQNCALWIFVMGTFLVKLMFRRHQNFNFFRMLLKFLRLHWGRLLLLFRRGFIQNFDILAINFLSSHKLVMFTTEFHLNYKLCILILHPLLFVPTVGLLNNLLFRLIFWH